MTASTGFLWQNVIKLASYDQKILGVKDTIKDMQKALQSKKDQIKQLGDALEKTKDLCQQEAKRVKLAELQATELKEQEDAKKKRLDETTNKKEFKAIENELKRLKSAIIEQEELLIQAWSTLENESKHEKKQQLETDEKMQLLHKEVAQLEASIVEEQERLVTFDKDRSKYMEVIPEEWLNKYERMKGKVDNPIVPIMNNCCSACYYSILLQDTQTLKKVGLLLCRNCYRFLYYDQEEEQDAQRARY